ncbi:ribosome small subunit-dependent GTPase A [Defluviimonas sp. WL0024]|uniref:Small ribosomal subunit biogenesis GTPase RsgA n=2 Tax=Albidovulum TaxID=205889 RepID=A0ABT3J6N9_9RHOB|nr:MULTISPECIES: ribosome small subunit-dependent GTPase A [Defluviimonas]MCU9850179.1 ribosome small subunit-dependent GTPase A [Defluviimonas sp. WL0024]MCW3783350.1 ribosome small subunit-dependent GTPase A [Defluviimonas salinarum]
MTLNSHTLADLGWSANFQRQLDTDEFGAFSPARVTGVHRDRLTALSEAGPLLLTLPPDLSAGDVAVGDWVLADPATDRVARLLDRHSRIFRRAAGEASREQLIVANVDTVFITTSATEEFNEARLERYLALAHAGGIPPVLVVTKADKADDPETYLDRLRAIAPAVPAILLNAKAEAAAEALRPWCGPGRTVAFLGMSGVGKSTLASALTGIDLETATVREDDMKGRHTTTAREMHPIPGGGWLIDTPGMRELRLTDMAEGIDEAFAEITGLTGECRFRDCTHGPEPGCAVQAAIAAGQVDAARLDRWKKLRAEDAAHAASAAEKRRRGKAFAKVVKQAKKAKRPN